MDGWAFGNLAKLFKENPIFLEFDNDGRDVQKCYPIYWCQIVWYLRVYLEAMLELLLLHVDHRIVYNIT